MSLSWYVAKDSFLHRASSLSKVAFVFCLWITCFVFASPLWNTLELFFIVGIIIAARIPFSSMKSLLKIILPVMVIFLVVFPLVDQGGTVYFQHGPIEISWRGISDGIIGATRLGSLFLSTIGILLTTTRERDLVDGLMKGGLPYEGSFLLMLTLRFVSLSMTDLTIIRESRRARATPERENLIQFLSNLISIVIPLFLATIRRIQISSNALEVKGFAPGSKRTNVRKGKVRKVEIFWGAFFVGLTVFLVVLRLEFGLFS
ncbi:MAG: energy-coupling factor transporter transmembrane component T family protein [Nitrososphaerales archaeon]